MRNFKENLLRCLATPLNPTGGAFGSSFGGVAISAQLASCQETASSPACRCKLYFRR